jgi:hypothetical protein
MPMFTTWRMRRPVKPVHAPVRIRVAKSAMRSSTAWTPGTTSPPSTTIEAVRGARRATCSTARRSVALIRSPANIASRRAATPVASARATRSLSVSSVTRFFE